MVTVVAVLLYHGGMPFARASSTITAFLWKLSCATRASLILASHNNGREEKCRRETGKHGIHLVDQMWSIVVAALGAPGPLCPYNPISRRTV